MQQIEIAELNDHLNAMLATALAGELVLITQSQKPVLKLVRVDGEKPMTKTNRRKRGSAKGLIRIAPDFDQPLPDFAEYMQ